MDPLRPLQDEYVAGHTLFPHLKVGEKVLLVAKDSLVVEKQNSLVMSNIEIQCKGMFAGVIWNKGKTREPRKVKKARKLASFYNNIDFAERKGFTYRILSKRRVMIKFVLDDQWCLQVR